MMSTTLTDPQASHAAPQPQPRRRFSLEIYKKGQGYWTRVMSAVGGGTIVLMGAAWLSGHLRQVKVGTLQPIYIQAGASAIILCIFGAIGYYLLALSPRVVDFLIATEGEMKKVNWSTRKELLGSTWVVICMTAMLGLLCFTFDSLFALLFRWMEVLEF